MNKETIDQLISDIVFLTAAEAQAILDEKYPGCYVDLKERGAFINGQKVGRNIARIHDSDGNLICEVASG